MNFALCKRTLKKDTHIPARYVLEDKSYQTRHKIDAGDVSLLMGSINYTILDSSTANQTISGENIFTGSSSGFGIVPIGGTDHATLSFFAILHD
jgi:hypothetical protein